jgi:Zn-dependent protease with chaperone function
MTIGLVLLAYAACAGTLGSRVLGQAEWTSRAPLLAIAAYLTAAWSVIAALGPAGLTLAVHATALGGGLSHLIGACVLRIRALYATPGGATVAGLGLVLAGAVLARTAVTAAAHLRVAGREARRHAETARLVGHPEQGLGATLVDHAQPAAYCVAGRHPTVILTTGAVRALDPDQLDAVLAHERAHLAAHHHRLRARRRGHRPCADPGAACADPGDRGARARAGSGRLASLRTIGRCLAPRTHARSWAVSAGLPLPNGLAAGRHHRLGR